MEPVVQADALPRWTEGAEAGAGRPDRHRGEPRARFADAAGTGDVSESLPGGWRLHEMRLMTNHVEFWAGSGPLFSSLLNLGFKISKI